MELAMIGLGRMGKNMALRLLNAQHRVVLFDQIPEVRDSMAAHKASVATSLNHVKNLLERPRIAWLMVPHGAPTDSVILELSQIFEEGDIIIDGGNSHFLASIKYSQRLNERGIHFLDVGVSGGVYGLLRGYCLMIGGDSPVVKQVEPIFKALAPGRMAAPPTNNRKIESSTAHEGYYHCGPSGAGHYVKMIHNAIEYSMMQSYAEGMEILHNATSEGLEPKERFNLDLKEIAELWRRGSVINSWLLDLLSEALHKSPHLHEFSSSVPDSGEGRWALMEAIKQGTPATNLASSLFARFRSRQHEPLSAKSLSALRKEFGGHEIRKST